MPGFGSPVARSPTGPSDRSRERVLDDGGHTRRVTGPQGAGRAEDLRDEIIVHGLGLSCRSRGYLILAARAALTLGLPAGLRAPSGSRWSQREFRRDVRGDADQTDDLDVEHFAGGPRRLEIGRPKSRRPSSSVCRSIERDTSADWLSTGCGSPS